MVRKGSCMYMYKHAICLTQAKKSGNKYIGIVDKVQETS